MKEHSVTAIAYLGDVASKAMKLLPHIEALGFDGEHFMHTAMQQLQGVGVGMMREAAITAISAGEHEVGNIVSHLVKNTGPVQGGGRA